MRFKARKKMRCESVPWERFRYDSAAESLVLVVPYHRKPAYLPLVLPKQAGRRRALLAKLAMPSDGKTYKREEIKLLRNNHLGQYYVVVQYRHYAVPRHTADRPRVVALDPGSRTFHSYYASDGRAGELGTNRERILRHALRLDRLQSRLSKSSATSAAPAVRVSENQGDPDADGIAGEKEEEEKRDPASSRYLRTERDLENRERWWRACFGYRLPPPPPPASSLPAWKRQRMHRLRKRMLDKARNRLADAHRHTARWLCERFDVVLLPKFKTSSMLPGLANRAARMLASWAHYRFRSAS